MARTLIRHPDHLRKRSLGMLAVWWIETFVLHGRGGYQGNPIVYGDEYAGFIVDCYALDAAGRRLYYSAFFSRPKGTDKSGLAAALSLFEAFGPCRFDGWAEGGETYEFLGETYTYQPGEPMGKGMKAPLIRIMATEEGQTGNVYDSIYYNLSTESAPLYALKAAYGVDVGKTRILIPHNGGSIVPMSAGAKSKDGGLETFAVFDETHIYDTPTLREMYTTVVQNLPKRRREGTWYIETTTMYEPGADSVAEATYREAELIQQGKKRRPRLLFDHRFAVIESLEKIKIRDPENPSLTRIETEDEYIARLTDAFYEAFGDAIAWQDVEGFLDDVMDTRRAVQNTMRYYFNAIVEGKSKWIRLAQWIKIGLAQRNADARARGEKPIRPPRAGDKIALGFDGGLSDDATVLIACRIDDGYVFPIGIWEAPDDERGKGWQVDHTVVEARLAATFKKYQVVAFLADPPHWRDYVDRWEMKYGPDLVVKATREKPISFETAQHTVMAKVVERTKTAIDTGELIHGEHPVLTGHVMNAHRWERAGGDVIGKDRKGSAKKMDAAIGMCLAVEGRARYRKQFKEKRTAVPVRAR